MYEQKGARNHRFNGHLERMHDEEDKSIAEGIDNSVLAS